MTILHAALQASALFAYALGCLALGAALLRLLLGARAANGVIHPFASFASAFILGQGAFSQILVLAGLVLDFTSSLVWTAIALSLALGVRHLLILAGRLGAALSESWAAWRGESLAWKAIAASSGALLALWACAAIVHPPSGDGEAFYFVYGKFIAAGDRLVPLTGSYEPFSTIGLVGELHFAALMSIASPAIAKLFVWLVACAACIALNEIAREGGLGYKGRLVTLVLLLTSSTFVLYIPDGKVDLFAVALGLGAYYWALAAWRSDAPLPAARLAGGLAGLACVAKFSYVPVLAPGLILLLLAKGGGGRGRVLLLANLALAAGIAVLSHLIKNAVFFGEPLAPFLTASSDRAWLNQVWFGPEATAWIVKTYPFALVFGQYPMQGGTLSFAWLALLPLAFFLPRSSFSLRNPLGLTAAAGLLGLVIWVVLRPSVIAPRYILAPLLLLFPPVGKAVENLSDSALRTLRHAAIACLLVVCAVNLIAQRGAARDAVLLASGKLAPCHQASPYCAELQRVNDLARPGERTLLYLYYSYWLRPDLLLCRNTHAEGMQIKQAANVEDAWAHIVASGMTLVVVDGKSHGAEFERLWQQRPGWLETQELHRGELLVAYRIRSSAPVARRFPDDPTGTGKCATSTPGS